MSLHEQLLSLATAIRVPEQAGDHDADTQRRLAIYQSLFYNNVEGFIRNGFPVLHSLFSKEHWHELVKTFFQQHACRSPYFVEISKEFVEFLSNAYELKSTDPVFLKELAHYEWLELALSVRKTDSAVTFWQGEGIPEYFRGSPVTELVGYPYAVHLIGPDFLPSEPGEMHYYLLYRDSNQSIEFQHLNPLAALTFELLNQQPTTLERLCDQVHNQAGGLPMNMVQQGVWQLVSQWLSCGAVIEA
ncbi:DUF2063 domain-containing protein [Alteromonas sp. AMM-1]|uniref:HvfC family RiPP maturation protein n=1 Tax=Alteromonas sp. AMM-1 TaxID=3394233 RepID=UPI0039A52F80